MKQYYPYQKELNFKPQFNLWQHDYTKWPFNHLVRRQIFSMYKSFSEYQTPLEVNTKILRSTFVASDGTKIPYCLISPNNDSGDLPVVIYYHGGGFICPLNTMMLNNASYYANSLHCRFILPQYRLAPTVPCNITLTDCYDMLCFVSQNHKLLHVDPDRLLIYGDSAGGTLACGVSLLARDQKGPKITGQMLIYPVTDIEIKKYKSMDAFSHAEWNKRANRLMWKLYLKHGDGNMLEYIVPMQNPDLSSLPPAYIEPQEFDTLRDEGFAYAARLRNANVPVTVNYVRGTFHGFDNDITNTFVQRVLGMRCAKMKEWLET